MQIDMTDLARQSLFNMPSASKGAARIMSIFGALDEYRFSDTNNEADSKAIANDWKIVGKDMSSAIKEYGKNPQK